jgi:hypothetical protein
MKFDYNRVIDEINIRYLAIHSNDDIEKQFESCFEDLSEVFNVEDISSILQVDVTSKKQDNLFSIIYIQVLNMPYSYIKAFEDNLVAYLNNDLEVYKTHDSFKLAENQDCLSELYELEMKIREIYIILSSSEKISLENSQVNSLKEYKSNEDTFKKLLMHELFFIGFKDYINVNKRKSPKFDDLLNVLANVEKIEDVSEFVNELSYPSLLLEERFGELSSIPAAIGRLEKVRNSIAHNRFLSKNDISQFNKAKNDIDYIYELFVNKFKKGEL